MDRAVVQPNFTFDVITAVLVANNLDFCLLAYVDVPHQLLPDV
jgi:hypothetical protein